MNRKLNRITSSPCSMLAFGVVSLALSSLSAVVAQPGSNYTCNPRLDYGTDEFCPKANIQDGTCDNPNLGGKLDTCLGQDCIDCNFHCK
jgi:hypothetical protein